jgi:gamma-carbonic anhydrase
MLIKHRGGVPQVHPSAYVAPTAVICGAVRIGPDARVLFGAVLSAEDGEISVGARSIVMENAVIRGRARHPAVIGDNVLVGPHAHVNGARVGDGCFLATGAALFPGCVAGTGSEVRIGGIVQVNTVLPPGTMIPIGWVAVGDPAKIYPPGQHEQIWSVQESLDFPGTVYGVTRETPAAERMSRQSAWFAAHLGDRIIDESSRGQNGLTAGSGPTCGLRQGRFDHPGLGVRVVPAPIRNRAAGGPGPGEDRGHSARRPAESPYRPAPPRVSGYPPRWHH